MKVNSWNCTRISAPLGRILLLDDIANIVCIKIILVYSAQLSITGVEDESWTEYIRVSHNGDSAERKNLFDCCSS